MASSIQRHKMATLAIWLVFNSEIGPMRLHSAIEAIDALLISGVFYFALSVKRFADRRGPNRVNRP